MAGMATGHPLRVEKEAAAQGGPSAAAASMNLLCPRRVLEEASLVRDRCRSDPGQDYFGRRRAILAANHRGGNQRVLPRNQTLRPRESLRDQANSASESAV
jgi:hypothetical protein